MSAERIRVLSSWATVTALALSSAGAVLWLLVRAGANAWRSPALFPQAWGARGLRVALDNGLVASIGASLIVALIATTIGCALLLPAAAIVERSGRAVRRFSIVALMLPVLVPGSLIGLGVATLAVRVGVGGSLAAVVATHLPFVLAWQAVTLLSAWDRSLPARVDAASANGVTPRQAFVRVTIPGVRRAALLAWGIGFLVSWAQYATSLFVGGTSNLLPVRMLPFVTSDPQVAAVFALALACVPTLIGAFVLMSRRSAVA